MELLNESTQIIKKSKFISYLYKLDTFDDVDIILNLIKKEHKKAKHIVYAYKFGNTAKKTDDKEPSGTAGLPILNVLDREKLDSHIIVVVRYFGGIKLGAGPLLRAYSSSANNLIKK